MKAASFDWRLFSCASAQRQCVSFYLLFAHRAGFIAQLQFSKADAIASTTLMPRVFLALLIVYLVWGYDCLAIRWGVAVELPYLFASIRFLAAGTPLLFYRRLLTGPPTVTALMLIAGWLIGRVSFAKGKVERYCRTSYSWEAWANLTVFGSCIGYGAYSWLVQDITTAMLGNYAYVKAVEAVLLGSWLCGESLSRLEVAGPREILVGLVLVTLSQSPVRAAAAKAEQ